VNGSRVKPVEIPATVASVFTPTLGKRKRTLTNCRCEWMQWYCVAHLDWVCRRSGSGSVVVVQQSADTLAPFYVPTLPEKFRIRTDQLVIEALVVAFGVVMRRELGRCPTSAARRTDPSPNKIIRSRHDSLIVRTKRSA
jgi:hypothetical protein